MTAEMLCIYLFGVLSIQGISGQLFRKLAEARLEGIHGNTIKSGIDTSIMCCVLCEGQDNCIAANHNKDLGLCEVVQTSSSKLIPTTNSTWNAYFKDITDIDYKSEASASQSTTIDPYLAAYAVDDVYLLDLEITEQCTHTDASTTNWLLIDFHRNYPIKDFSIWNRNQDPSYTRLHDLTITVSRTLATMDDADSHCTTYTGPPSSPADNPILLSCGRNMEGRFLRILIDTTINNILTVCEVDLM